MEEPKQYLWEDFIEDIKNKTEAPCVICGTLTTTKFRNYAGYFEHVCDYPKECKIKWLENDGMC